MAGKHLTYSAAGVSTKRGDNLVDRIIPAARSTHRPEVMASVGGFAALSNLPKGYRDPVLVTSTDGVGTKILLAAELRKYDTVGIDLVAMSVNDILTLGAEPFLFLDYYATGKLDVKVGEQIVRGVAKGCKQAGCALVGGETAEMPQVYRGRDFDLAGFCVGVVERKKIVDGTRIRPGDAIIGLPSNGIHSNGYSLVRAILRKSKASLRSHGEDLLRPTRIYVREVLKVLSKVEIKGMAHITGSGIEGNLPRVFPRGTHAEVWKGSWKTPKVFRFLQKAGNVSEAEMFRTFNMGIGFALVVSVRDSERVLRIVNGSRVIGRIIKGRGEPQVVWKS